MTPRRYSKGAAKQAGILDAALDLIARNGYRDTSLRQIAATANISLMHYFASKEHLLIEVLCHRKRFATFRNLAATAIADARRAGRFDPRVDPLLAASNLLAVMDGIQMQWLLDTTIDMGEQVESCLSRMASGYAMTTVTPRSRTASIRPLPASTP